MGDGDVLAQRCARAHSIAINPNDFIGWKDCVKTGNNDSSSSLSDNDSFHRDPSDDHDRATDNGSRAQRGRNERNERNPTPVQTEGLEFGENGLTGAGWESVGIGAEGAAGGRNRSPTERRQCGAERAEESRGPIRVLSNEFPVTGGLLFDREEGRQQQQQQQQQQKQQLRAKQRKRRDPQQGRQLDEQFEQHPPPWLQSNVKQGIVEGWLQKRTRRGRWVRRWYLLDSTGIYYSHSPPSSSSSAMSSKKFVKLVNARTLAAKNVRTNPAPFEVWHPSQNRAMAALRATNANEAQQWVDAINHACKRQRLVDKVVVGSVALENLEKNTVDKIDEQMGHNPFFEEELPPLAHPPDFLLYQTTTTVFHFHWDPTLNHNPLFLLLERY